MFRSRPRWTQCTFRALLGGLTLLLGLTLTANVHAGRYLITVIDAEIAAKKGRFARWDTGFGSMTKPDVYVVLDVAGQRLKTTIVKNATKATWNISQTFTLKGTERVYIEVKDKDRFTDDPIGKTSVPFSRLQMGTKLTFGKVLSLRIKVTTLPDKGAVRKAPVRKAPVRKAPVRREPAARPVVRREPAARPVVRREPAARPVVRREPAARPVPRREPAARPVDRREPAARPVDRREPAARPVVRREPAARPVARREPAARPVVRREPAARPVPRREPAARPVPRREPAARPVVRKAPAALTPAGFCITMLKQSLMCLEKQHTQLKTDPKQKATAQFIANIIKRLKGSLQGPGRAQIVQKCLASLKRDGWQTSPSCLSCLKAQGCVQQGQLKKACHNTCTGGAGGPGAKPMVVPASMADDSAPKKKVIQ